MAFSQLITPTPLIPCTPGWCLQYVRLTFGLLGVHATATDAWESSPTQHADRDFPDCWVPVWYGLDNEPAGHVVLRAPNGNVYSTSDLGSTPHLHPDLEDLERYYAFYGMPLTFRGWTEDIENVPVVASSGLAAMGETITPLTAPAPAQEDDEMSAAGEARILQILEAFESDNTRQRIIAIDDRTAQTGIKYLKGDTDATLYSFEGGKLRGINLVEWQATGQGYRTLPQDIIDALPKA